MAEIVNDWPPNIDKIRAVLPVTDRNIFAYGGKIYSPGATELSPELHAHEKVHFRQQGDHVEEWWDRFLADPAFRLDQELPAHTAEYRHFCKRNRDRNNQKWFLRVLGKRLAAPMYGGLIGVKAAMRAIEHGKYATD